MARLAREPAAAYLAQLSAALGDLACGASAAELTYVLHVASLDASRRAASRREDAPRPVREDAAASYAFCAKRKA
jgi:hypothetical protein